MSEKDGGPAFPCFERWEEWSNEKATHVMKSGPLGGMTLRDYFAATALPQAIAHEIAMRSNSLHPPAFSYDEVAHAAYVMADAMLAERART